MAQFGIAILRELGILLLIFVTSVLIVYVFLSWPGAKERMRRGGR